VILFGAFIKYFVFGEAPPSSSANNDAAATSRRRRAAAAAASESQRRQQRQSKQTLSQDAVRHGQEQDQRTAGTSGTTAIATATTTMPDEPELLPSNINNNNNNNSNHRSRSLRKKQSSLAVLGKSPQLTPTAILDKTYYNVRSHLPESVDWFNVLFAQTLAQLRHDAEHDDAILASLNSVFNGPLKPGFLADVTITELSLGENFPIFSNCRVIPVDDDGEDGGGGGGGTPRAARRGADQDADGGEAEGKGGGGRLQARMDVDVADCITLGVETKLVLNYPRPAVAVLPVALTVSVVRFTGTVIFLLFFPSFFLFPHTFHTMGVNMTLRKVDERNFF
jgi:maintenance of morphology protein 1